MCREPLQSSSTKKHKVEEDLLLVQEEDLLLVQEADLLLVQEEDLPTKFGRSLDEVWTKFGQSLDEVTTKLRRSYDEDRVLPTKFLRR